LETITRDVSVLVKRILTEGEADGIFFAVRGYEGVSKEDYRKFIEPGEREVLRRAAEIKGNTILHICGDTKGKNDFPLYAAYEASAYNWAVGRDLSISDGLRLFGERSVMGGFDNTRSGELYRGDRKAIERRASELNGSIILGADCALPPEINYDHLKILRDYIRSR
jgi:uroporphyrinogen decarboxylase